jgi:hypothetical protein
MEKLVDAPDAAYQPSVAAKRDIAQAVVVVDPKNPKRDALSVETA